MPIIVRAAGDIACDPQDPDFKGQNTRRCQHRATAKLLDGADVVFAVGDTQYECGGSVAFRRSFDPSWGAYEERTFAVPGDGEYQTSATQPNAPIAATAPTRPGTTATSADEAGAPRRTRPRG